MKKILIPSILLISAICLTSCGEETYYRNRVEVSVLGFGYGSKPTKLVAEDLEDNTVISAFNTPIYIERYQTNTNFSNIKDVIDSNYHMLHAYFDRHYYYSIDGVRINNLKVLNESYGSGEFVEVPQELYDIIKKSVELSTLSKGKFNIAVGPLSDLWESYFTLSQGNNHYLENIPTEEEINDALSRVPTYEDLTKIVEFSDENCSIKLNKIDNYDSVSFTLGAIGKGYATKKLEETLKNVCLGYINAGESSISMLSEFPFGDWVLELSNPLYRQLNKKKDNEVDKYNAYELRLKKSGIFSFSTSGNYEKFCYNEDGLYHHIIDPNTGYSCSYFDAVSVVCDDSTYADALTTSLMNMSLEEGISFVEKFEETYNIEVNPIWFKVNNTKVNVTADKKLESNLYIYSEVANAPCSEISFIELSH